MYSATQRQHHQQGDENQSSREEANVTQHRNKTNDSAANQKKNNKFCVYCKNYGHKIEECRKLKKKKENTKESASTTQKEVTFSTEVYFNEQRQEYVECFILDSGTTKHVSGQLSLFDPSTLKSTSAYHVKTASGTVQPSMIGDMNLNFHGVKLTLKDVLYWPNAPNLLSVPLITSKGFNITFYLEKAAISLKNKNILTIPKLDGAYRMKFKQDESFPAMANRNVQVWHHRLNHVSNERLRYTLGAQ